MPEPCGLARWPERALVLRCKDLILAKRGGGLVLRTGKHLGADTASKQGLRRRPMPDCWDFGLSCRITSIRGPKAAVGVFGLSAKAITFTLVSKFGLIQPMILQKS